LLFRFLLGGRRGGTMLRRRVMAEDRDKRHTLLELKKETARYGRARKKRMVKSCEEL
jgi:hypothetical protein